MVLFFFRLFIHFTTYIQINIFNKISIVKKKKVELLYFDGDSLKYPRFIKSFELNVESTIEDDNVRLSYLIQYCTRKAKEAIENCVILPGAEGYKAARDILKRNFGQRMCGYSFSC